MGIIVIWSQTEIKTQTLHDLTCIQVKKKGTFQLDSKNISLDAARYFHSKRTAECFSAVTVGSEFRWTLWCSAAASDVWLMSLLASIKGLELRWLASTSGNKSERFARTDRRINHRVTSPLSLSLSTCFLCDLSHMNTAKNVWNVGVPTVLCALAGAMGRQQVHLQQTVSLLMVKGKRWFTPAKQSIGPQRSLASSSCTTVYLMHLALKPMRCLNRYLLLWWNGPEILGRWTAEALASESPDQLASCSGCILDVYMDEGDTGNFFFFFLHSRSSENEVLTAAPIDQRG